MPLPEYDLIFAGGGTAACLIAGRLAAANSSLKILIIEAGNHTFNVATHVQPARCLSHLAAESTTSVYHESKPSEHLDGRSVFVPCAKAVGGGSSINYMMYTRASASDYDDWEYVHRNPGWNAEHLESLLKKTETYQVQPSQPTHGYSGPLHVSLRHSTNVGDDFIRTGVQYDTGRKLVDDANDLHTIDAYAKWAKWIDNDTGMRSDTAHHFIYNQTANKNLHVLDRSLVKRVLIKDGRAVGVEYFSDDETLSQDVRIAMALRLVVVSAGAFGSPPILERSGIGARTVLEKLGVEVVVDLPGVGENYRDHTALLVPYKAAEEAETLDAIFRNDPVEVAQAMSEWETTGGGLMGTNGFDAAIKLRPNAADLQEIGPTFTKQYLEHFENAPDKPVLCMIPMSAYYADQSTVPVGKYFTMVFYIEYPASAGSLHISSGTNPRAPLDFDSGYLAEPADLAILRWGYKRAREYARRMGFFRGELQDGHPAFISAGAAIGKETLPVAISAPDIVYSQEDDDALETFAKKMVCTTGHSLGTCAMKPRDEMGVVDPKLNVYGVKSLKVADMSIAPANISANTYSTALLIGEKASVIIAEEFGIWLD